MKGFSDVDCNPSCPPVYSSFAIPRLAESPLEKSCPVVIVRYQPNPVSYVFKSTQRGKRVARDVMSSASHADEKDFGLVDNSLVCVGCRFSSSIAAPLSLSFLPETADVKPDRPCKMSLADGDVQALRGDVISVLQTTLYSAALL